MKKILMFAAIVFAAVSSNSCQKNEDTSNADYQVKVIFNAWEGTFSNGKSTLDTNVQVRTDITKPENPTLMGHEFAGWCIDPECETPVEFPVCANSDKTFYAKWKYAGPEISDINVLLKGMKFEITMQDCYHVIDISYEYDNENRLSEVHFFEVCDSLEKKYDGLIRFKYDGLNATAKMISGGYEIVSAALEFNEDGQCTKFALTPLMSAGWCDTLTNTSEYDEEGYFLKTSLFKTNSQTDTLFNAYGPVFDNYDSYKEFSFKANGKVTTFSLFNSGIVNKFYPIQVFSPTTLSALFASVATAIFKPDEYKVLNYVFYAMPFFETPSLMLPRILTAVDKGGMVYYGLDEVEYSEEGFARYLHYTDLADDKNQVKNNMAVSFDYIVELELE